MPAPDRLFAFAATAFFTAGVATWTTAQAAVSTGMPPPAWLPDHPHLLTAGVGGALVGLALVKGWPSFAPDPEGLKGAAPRAFWTFVLGVVLVAFASPQADSGPPLLAAAALAGGMLETVAGGMFLVALLRAGTK